MQLQSTIKNGKCKHPKVAPAFILMLCLGNDRVINTELQREPFITFTYSTITEVKREKIALIFQLMSHTHTYSRLGGGVVMYPWLEIGLMKKCMSVCGVQWQC